MNNEIKRSVSALEARLAQIEIWNAGIVQANRRLRRLLLTLPLAVCAALLVLGATNVVTDFSCKTLTVERISVVDADGRQVMLLGQGELGQGLAVFNKEGVKVVAIGVAADILDGGLVIQDQEGKPRIGLGMQKDVPGLAFTNKEGHRVLVLGVDKERSGLIVRDESGADRAGILMSELGPTVCVTNKQGGVEAEICADDSVGK